MHRVFLKKMFNIANIMYIQIVVLSNVKFNKNE